MLYLIVERIRRMFDLNADWAAITPDLGTAPRVDFTDWRRPGASRTRLLDGFELTTRAILGQQITVQDAQRACGENRKVFGQHISGGDNLTHLFPTPGDPC